MLCRHGVRAGPAGRRHLDRHHLFGRRAHHRRRPGRAHRVARLHQRRHRRAPGEPVGRQLRADQGGRHGLARLRGQAHLRAVRPEHQDARRSRHERDGRRAARARASQAPRPARRSPTGGSPPSIRQPARSRWSIQPAARSAPTTSARRRAVRSCRASSRATPLTAINSSVAVIAITPKVRLLSARCAYGTSVRRPEGGAGARRRPAGARRQRAAEADIDAAQIERQRAAGQAAARRGGVGRAAAGLVETQVAADRAGGIDRQRNRQAAAHRMDQPAGELADRQGAGRLPWAPAARRRRPSPIPTANPNRRR